MWAATPGIAVNAEGVRPLEEGLPGRGGEVWPELALAVGALPLDGGEVWPELASVEEELRVLALDEVLPLEKELPG